MRILLDTQCWLWMQAAPERFSPSARALVEGAEHELLLSAASSWEIAIKYSLGRLDLPEPPASYVPSRMASDGILGLPVGHAHAVHVATLPPYHRDPFDRLLVAQAMVEEIALLTSDRQLAGYDVEILWAA